MSKEDVKFPVGINGELVPVGVDYLKEHWQECWSDTVIARHKLESADFLEEYPEKKEGAKKLAEAIDKLIEDNPELRVPFEDNINMAIFLELPETYPVWYQKMTGMTGYVRYLTVKK